MQRFWWLLFMAAPAWSQQLRWDANGERDLAGYKVYVGYQSGARDSVFDVEPATFFQLHKSDPRTRFLTVTAYDTAGNESAFSSEIVYAPDMLSYRGDLNGDGRFDAADSSAFYKAYKTRSTSNLFNARADYDRSNYIGDYDRGYFEALWQNRKQ